MSAKPVDGGRRKLLLVATSVVGGVATVGAMIPFVASMMPSERARAAGAPVEVDISKLEPGMLVQVEWRGKVCWVLNRTKEMLATLDQVRNLLADPDSRVQQQPAYATNAFRSIKPEYLVLVGICTHLGCSPTFRPDVKPADLGADWLGGFFCPCHGSKFDLAGRVYSGVPAPTNLEVPPHKYLSDTLILIGEDSKGV
ncbi:MAG: ubiquinol-cytochrome c reductase iron-sulfur subunit [Pseudomonadota bacterium]